jgi:hypothetical protein
MSDWSTDDEIAFLANLGRHRAASPFNRHLLPAGVLERTRLLSESRGRVRRWDDGIDVAVIDDFIDMELDRIRATGQPYEGTYEEVCSRYQNPNAVVD